ncbi:hypothetical protein ASF49_11240 [Methylobacterium sp. Leaf104]|uniref:tetratricopeptide repeat protein n=1 Tax=Methylobacterium TaxID=407 RepID=UPI0006F488B9|nr:MULTISPECIES: tetratricopeptide repeat protein [Methylobacterium]KQP31299.1 hypothetical protein ASF49_11240 [Methylobacterium sp. Leaf104]MCI9881231.1 SEL1-like repeat protein [Methylobacterium goesingense]
MTRNATLDLEGFDPDVLEAARDMARRAGIPVETWIASIVEPDARGDKAPTAPAPSRPPAAEAAQTAAPSSPVEVRSAAPTAGVRPGKNAALTEMMRRLDGIDQRIGSEAPVPAAPALPQAESASEMAQRLAEIERRMTEIGEQLATPRPLGRRGRPAVTEIRDAVTEIRQRQRELAGAPAASAPAQPAPPARPVDAPAIAELQNETTRLRESIGSLASGRDVGALEKAMQTLAAGVQKAQAPADLAAIAAPIEAIRAQVERLAEDVAENVHARVAADVERLAARMNGTLQGVPSGLAEQDVVAGLFRELDEIRRLIGALAGPERIQSLAAGIQAISNQVSQIQTGMPGEGMAELRPLLEEIRIGLRSSTDAGIGEQIQQMDAKLDALRGVGPMAAHQDSDIILHRIDALSEKVDRVSINPVGDLIGRLEDIGATLRRPAQPDENLASIHGMLHELTVKLDRIGTGEGPRDEGLDALEQQVLALAERIDTRDADPALAGLERTMTDLLDQVSALRAEAPMEAAVERAARNAVAETMGAAAETGEVALLRASLADLRAHQVASEQRMQSTLTGVYSALERLVGRIGPTDPDAPLVLTPRMQRDVAKDLVRDKDLVRELSREPSAEHPAGTAPSRRPDAMRAERPQVSGPDLPLEPGAGRPGRDRAAGRIEPSDAGAADSDIKTSFIAAARRAAQAAQAEAAGQTGASDAEGNRDGADAGRRAGRLARFRSGVDRRRKPLLLGLAAVVLLLGALQALNARRSAGTETPAAEPVAAVSTPAGPVAAGTDAASKSQESQSENGKAAAPPVADPQTTQSLAESAPAKAAGSPASRSAVPRVTTMAGISADLAVVPPALVKLRQAALDGDGAAAYDLGMRAAEGRGMARDPALAVKIFEQIAASGFAPAQYKLGSLYEKGVGVARDLNQAKLWYGRAAELGNARAMHNLAVIYAENPAAGGKADFATASLWFKRAAEFGLRDSQYNLAVLYARGMGVQQDLAQSFLWFSAAAAQGDEDAAKKRDDVAAKLDVKALAAARAQVAAFKPKVPEPASNEIPAPLPTENTMSLLGAPAPSGNIPPARRI